MYKLKTFCDKPEKLDQAFNQFFKENPHIEVIKMGQCQADAYKCVAVTILYIEK